MKNIKKDFAMVAKFAALPEEEKLAFIERLRSTSLPPKDIELIISKINQLMQVASKLKDENATMKDIQEIYGIKTK